MNVNYLDTSFDDPLQGLLSDYQDTRLTATLNRVFTDRMRGILSATGRRFEIDDRDDDVTGYGLMGGFEYSVSETTTAKAVVGFEEADSDLSDTDPSFVADFSLRRRLETINFLAQYRRTVSANGSGKLSVRDAVNLNLSRLLSEKITAGLGVRVFNSDPLDETLDINSRDYVQLRAQFIWNITSAFAAEVDYRFTLQKRSQLPESSNSNQVILWLSYQPNSVDRRFRR